MLSATFQQSPQHEAQALPAKHSPPGQLHFHIIPSQGVAGQTIGLQITVEDSLGNLIRKGKPMVSLSITSGPGQFEAGSNLQVKAKHGLAFFNTLRLNTAGYYLLAAMASGLIPSTTAGMNILAAAPTQLTFVQTPAQGTVGQPLGSSVKVALKDQFGNLATNAVSTISLSIQSGPGHLVGGPTVSVGTVNGVATFNGLTFDAAGAYRLTAGATGLTAATSGTITLTAAIPVVGPNILLTPDVLTKLRAAAAANTPQWQAFKARLDQNLTVVLNEGDYQGSELSWISDYALGYQVLKNLNPLTAANYADKAIALMKSGLRDFQKAGWEARQFLAQGDGSTKTFTLPNADLIPSTLRVYISDVTTKAVTHGTANGQDSVDSYQIFLGASKSPKANYYQQGTDWRYSGDYQNDQIDWSLSGAEPATGGTYYVTMTSGLNAVQTQAYTLNGNKITFDSPLPAGKAVFVEYIYGTHSADGSTLAYQQTGAGDGGFNSIYVDTGYTSRYLGKHIAMGLDWLDGYAGFSPALKTEAINMLVRWSDYIRDNGYLAGNPASNYEAGAYVSRVMTALALQGRDPRAANLLSQVLTYRTQKVVPLLQNPTTSLKGGFWAEGWSYGALATENLLLAGQALESAGKVTAAAEHQWANEVVENLISEQSSINNLYDGGQWYDYPARLPTRELFYSLSSMAGNAADRAYANYIIQKYPDSAFANSTDTHDFTDLLQRDPTAVATFWSALPLQNFATGTGLLTARSDWGTTPNWMSIEMGNLLGADHQTYSPGHMELARGADQLLVNANVLGSTLDYLNPGQLSQYANTVAVNDNGEGMLIYPYGMGSWYGTPGVVTKAYEADASHVYFSGDYHAAYSSPTDPGAGGPTSELTRQVVYLRPDFVVVYDRVTTLKDTYAKELRWHFAQAPTMNGNTFVETVGSSKLFGATFSEQPIKTSLSSVKLGNNVTVQRVTTQNANPSTSARFVTAFQLTGSGTSQMVATQHITSTDGRMEGVQMGNQLVVFGRDGDVDLNTPINYSVNVTSVTHNLLTNLVAGQKYDVVLNNSSHVVLTASTAGTIAFDPPLTGTVSIQVKKVP
ncbi:MAG: DUF4815 domain-containing protein [Planctomycetales bacterium]